MQTSRSSQAELPAALEQAGVTNPGMSVLLLQPQDTNSKTSFKKTRLFWLFRVRPCRDLSCRTRAGAQIYYRVNHRQLPPKYPSHGTPRGGGHPQESPSAKGLPWGLHPLTAEGVTLRYPGRGRTPSQLPGLCVTP